MPICTNSRGKMMPQEDSWTPVSPKQFLGAFAPFPRFAWIHPNAPRDSFDEVCKNVWSRGQSSLQREASKDSTRSVNKRSHRAERQQEGTDDYMHYKEDEKQHHTDFTPPCHYLSGRRYPRVAKPAWGLSPVKEAEMRQFKEEASGKRNLSCQENDVQDKPRSVENSLQKMWVSQPSSKGKESSVLVPQHLVTNPVCFEGHTPHLPDGQHSLHPSNLPRDTCEIAGADGVGVSARSWANVAKAGMKQAAAPQEKARPSFWSPGTSSQLSSRIQMSLFSFPTGQRHPF
ncbi:uncharacterized protein LOC115788627 isoform X7 [Archocentrus centrarchus]|uniref:uncharacterized protein LOC115788627 isoform X7 n=1 Tax=Archocentrus centrarchus TaxID=63155 RepID=UPI0011EA13B5|nr:uncharacterized protein LOC115788627 isoform X7 [Archocentrus centrarchus]